MHSKCTSVLYWFASIQFLCSVSVFQKQRLRYMWPPVIIVLFSCFSSCSSLRHTSAEQMKRASIARRWGELLACLGMPELTSLLLGARWRRGGPTPQRTWLRCLSHIPMALFCQPPCLMQIGPYTRGPGKPPPSSICLSPASCTKARLNKENGGRGS